MSKDKPRNMAASVRQRLMDLARKQGDDFQLLLTRYAIERFLYRLSCSDHREEFVLKGAMLFRLWNDQPHRPTRDLDLPGKGDHSIEHLVEVFKTIAALAVEDDGLAFEQMTKARIASRMAERSSSSVNPMLKTRKSSFHARTAAVTTATAVGVSVCP